MTLGGVKQFIFTTSNYIVPSIIILLFFTAILVYPYDFSKSYSTGCLVGDAPSSSDRNIMMPAIINVGAPRGESGGWAKDGSLSEFVLIRKNVPIFTNSNDPTYLIGYPDWMGKDNQVPGESKLRWPIIADEDYLGRHADIRHTKRYTGPFERPGAHIYYPMETGEIELPFVTTDRLGARTDSYLGVGSILTLRTEGLLLFVHVGGNGEAIKVNYGQHIYYVVDFYQDKTMFETPDSVKGYYVDDMFRCLDPDSLTPTLVYEPAQNKSQQNTQLQLQWFALSGRPGMYAHCKPAVYLYPKKKQQVNVKVFPRGELSYTDPLYDNQTGWTVDAYPDGAIYDSRAAMYPKPFPYLYYESKILDTELKKPQTGWVVEKNYLSSFFSQTLPQLGLNTKEAKDFSDYWLKTLPDSPYYFIGLMDKVQRDFLEPLVVTPQPDTSIRFSFYFEPLKESKNVKAPTIVTPQRSGFTLVDWGGMIKLHPGTPFTCSQ